MAVCSLQDPAPALLRPPAVGRVEIKILPTIPVIWQELASGRRTMSSGGDRMKKIVEKTAVRAARARRSTRRSSVGRRPTSLQDYITAPNLKPLWRYTVSLRPVQNMMALGWHRFLPAAVGTTFLGIAVAVECGFKGDKLWEELDGFIEGVLRAEPDPEQKPKVDFIDRRFRDYYGDYERTPVGILKVLTDLGLIILRQKDGQDVIEIPANLPNPETKLGLCVADMDETVVFKARYRNGGGPRCRVMFSDLPAIRQLLNAGWGRHLPPDLVYAFFAAASVSVGRCTGKLMWENIEDLWKAQREHKHPLMPKRKELEVEARFREEYARTFTRTARGAVDVLLDLGLLVMNQVDGEDFLEVPEILPTPDMRLFLSEAERSLLAERLKIKI